MSPHAQTYRPIFHRTRSPWWRRLRGAIAVLLLVSLLATGVSWVIARMEATDAQLRAAHAQGMAVGMQTCPGL